MFAEVGHVDNVCWKVANQGRPSRGLDLVPSKRQRHSEILLRDSEVRKICVETRYMFDFASPAYSDFGLDLQECNPKKAKDESREKVWLNQYVEVLFGKVIAISSCHSPRWRDGSRYCLFHALTVKSCHVPASR